MNSSSNHGARFALSAVAAAALALAASSSWALGLGRLSVQSALGEALRAEIDVTSMSAEEAGSLRVRIAPPESYRAAGVDYNAVLPNTTAQLERRADGRPYLRLTSDRSVQEPFVDVILEISWSSGRLVREYTMLFDPPGSRTAPPAVAAAPTPPVLSAAPTPPPQAAAGSGTPQTTAAPPVAPAPLPPQATTAPRTAAAPTPTPSVTVPAAPPAPAPRAAAASRPAAPPVAAAPSPAASSAQEQYRVRSGDTLSKIAARTQRPGVSLDQMLVSLYRANPQAFVDDNMNRLRAGVVLDVPSADTAQQTPPAEARQVIQAQSADFSAYRQRLASGAPTMKSDEPARQARGQVQAQVDDRKQSAGAAPDKLQLSQGAVKASAPEGRISREAEKKDAATRVAELSRNVEELKKLSSGTAASQPAGTPAPAAAAPVPPVAAAPQPASAAAPVPVKPPAPVVAQASAAASVPVMPASAPAPEVAAASAPTPAPAPVAAAKPPAPPVPAAPSPVPEEPGFVSSLLDNPLVLPVAGLLVALLAGLGFYRLRSKARKDSGETSFLESRLQPDSFFGASGGQRIDTRDATGVSSSMSYSLSQLDAIGDVDPVAEADVYLAYGRDLQAEEILKEAMRGNPERLAIRTKLLEVYAKRRDTKGYELLATQLFAMTRGEGDEWHKAQEMGLQIDPENPLYQSGGKPAAVLQGGDPMAEPLGASTMPQSVLPTASTFATTDSLLSEPSSLSGVDLDLDLDALPTESQAPTPAEITQPLPPVADADEPFDFDLPDLPATPQEASQTQGYAAAPAEPLPEALAFDLGDLSLDLDAPPSPAPAPAADEPAIVEPTAGFDDLDLPPTGADAFAADDADPLQRKLELAEEFRQIGDTEGARDLLEEVIAKAAGPLKTRAQGLLDALV